MTVVDLGAAPGAGRNMQLESLVTRASDCLRYFADGFHCWRFILAGRLP